MRAGLCEHCRHLRVVVSGTGSRFFLCRKSQEDSRFPKYPPLPVLRCAGFEPVTEPADKRDGGPAGAG